jgi:MFS family permease
MIVMFGTFYSFGIFFEPVIMEFGWTRAVISGAFSLSFFLHGLLSIVVGKLNDRFGPRMVMVACGFLLGLGYLLMSRVGAIWQLYLFYGVLIGIGMSAAILPLVSTVARWFAKRRGLMTGIVVSGIGLGTIIMPPVASRLISIYGWQTSYIIVGIIALVLIISAAQFLRRDPGQIGQLPYGENEVKEPGSNLEATGFTLQQAIHTRQLWMNCAIFLCFGLGVQTIIVHIVIHATGLGISAIIAANILAVIGGSSIIGRITLGSASDRIGSKLAIMIGSLLMSAALLWLPLAKEVWMLYLFAVVFGFAYGGMVPLGSLSIAELFGLHSHGVILGIQSFILTIGGAIGPVLAGRIFDITGSYYLAFLISATLSVLATLLTTLLRPISKEGGGK